MKHADPKKIAALFGIGILSVSAMTSCGTYGPDAAGESLEACTLHFDELGIPALQQPALPDQDNM